MTYVMYALAAVFVLDALRLRGRVRALAVLAPSDAPASHVVVAAPGVAIAEPTLRAASAYMRAHDLDVLDLVPGDLHAVPAMTLVQLVDPPRYRGDRLGPGRTAGHALVVSPAVAARARLDPAAPLDTVEFTRWAVRLAHYGRADVAIAPELCARPADVGARYEVLRVLLGPSTTFALVALPVILTLVAVGCAVAPTAGLVALAAWYVQPVIAFVATPLVPRDLALAFVFRLPVELAGLARTVFGHRDEGAAAARRVDYDRELAAGVDRLLEPRRDSCPLCAGTDLVVQLRNRDLLQHKPGTFTLERCRGCGHVFQNPRLSLDGLAFYYRDFYDGLGEDSMEFVFGVGIGPYLARARIVKDAGLAPARWLDVGAGHGHFCMAARRELPATRFDGLDFGESIAEAERRGWVDKAYHGLFPERARELAGSYDAISMSHYLEHTRDPAVELDAAREVLAPGGCLLIEVPDPEFWLGRMLGRWWLPWFQPQHQHFVSVGNLDRLLRERGLRPVTWHRGAAHQRVDLFFAVFLWLGRIAPKTDLPWRWRGAGGAAWRVIAWTLGSPLLLTGFVVDNAIGAVFSRSKVSNTYRVLAIKDS